jgi:magnesium-transporting ATPase (P-type)
MSKPVEAIPAAAGDREQDWQGMEPLHVLKALQTNAGGLTREEAAARLRASGPNVLPQKPPPTLAHIILRQFKSPLIYVLAIAAVVSGMVGDLKDAGFIAFVLVVNAAIGTFQEWRAERSSQALQKLLRVRAVVLRDAELTEIDAEEVAPGDVVWIESGNRIPADIRLLETTGLEVDESMLTGESFAVQKEADWLGAADTPLADRRNMAFAGSVVHRGRGRGVAVATGRLTAIGKLAEHIVFARETTPPLVQRMEKFSFWIAVALVIVSVIIAIAGVLVQGRPMQEMFFFVVALAVSAIPEGLPAALAVALSVATSRMSRRGVIVRRLPAVEGLGSCTLIASDKTGTLTCNELTVREIRLPDGRILEVTGEGFAPAGQVLAGGRPVEPAEFGMTELVHAALLCNEGELYRHGDDWSWHGDPTDVALLSMARKLGWKRETALSSHPQVNNIPFEPERRFAASFHRGDEGIRVYVKGAPEKVLAMCDMGGEAPDSAHARAALDMASRGYRVLALAAGDIREGQHDWEPPPEPEGLEFLGFVGMIDPLRAGVREAVEACRSAGVQVWMVTGDHPVTALAISRDLCLADSPDQVITGADLRGMGPEAIEAAIRRVRVFARVAPDQKLQLVDAAKAAGHFVAVTGDGVNDAPALRAAHIGVAMGRSGTDVAREAGELVLTDDNFASVVGGVEEGRIAYKNIRNVITLLVSTGGAEVTIAGLSLVAGLPLPLLPVQLLWLNLATNGIQHLGLAFEPAQGDELHSPPRSPDEPIFNRLMLERVLISSIVMGIMGFGLFKWMRGAGFGEAEARNILLLFMVLFENVQIGNCRSETVSAFRLSPFRSPFLLLSTIAAFLLHLSMMHLPFGQDLLGTAPVSLETWAVLVPLALVILVVMEIQKWAWRRYRL